VLYGAGPVTLCEVQSFLDYLMADSSQNESSNSFSEDMLQSRGPKAIHH
jgi:hypothetical protein